MEGVDQYKIIAIQNIDSEDFEFAYNKHPYVIKAGEVRRMPAFLARHAVKHLIDKILTKKDIRTNHPTMRDEIASKIVLSEEDLTPPAPKTPDQELMETVEELNKPSELDKILSKRKAETPQKVETTEVPEKASETPNDEVFEGLMGEDSQKTETPAETPPSEDFPFTERRKELFQYAEKELGMDMNDKKTLAKLKSLDDEALAKELQHPSVED